MQYHGFEPYFAEATAANAVVDLGAPQAGKRWQIENIEFSYDGDPTIQANLTVRDGGVIVRKTNITTSGAGPLPINTRFSVDGSVDVTLSSAGVGILGCLNVSARQIS